MIDYLSLALGHGLLAVAFLRLVMREDLDTDPWLKDLADKADTERGTTTNAGRAALRRKRDVKVREQAGKAEGVAG